MIALGFSTILSGVYEIPHLLVGKAALDLPDDKIQQIAYVLEHTRYFRLSAGCWVASTSCLITRGIYSSILFVIQNPYIILDQTILFGSTLGVIICFIAAYKNREQLTSDSFNLMKDQLFSLGSTMIGLGVAYGFGITSGQSKVKKDITELRTKYDNAQKKIIRLHRLMPKEIEIPSDLDP